MAEYRCTLAHNDVRFGPAKEIDDQTRFSMDAAVLVPAALVDAVDERIPAAIPVHENVHAETETLVCIIRFGWQQQRRRRRANETEGARAS